MTPLSGGLWVWSMVFTQLSDAHAYELWLLHGNVLMHSVRAHNELLWRYSRVLCGNTGQPRHATAQSQPCSAVRRNQATCFAALLVI